jgi:hypothetical protein
LALIAVTLMLLRYQPVSPSVPTVIKKMPFVVNEVLVVELEASVPCGAPIWGLRS